jgi:inorganic pyrophosphatase
MHLPTNYGYVPKTISGDGDPVDVLVITPVPLIPGVVVPCRPIGILKMQDEAGEDARCWPCRPTRSCRSTRSGRSRRT